MQTSGLTLPLFGGDQQPVDQVRLQPRLGRAGDDQQLVDVGDRDVPPAADRAADRAPPRLDPLDGPSSWSRPPDGNEPGRRPRPRARWSVLRVFSSRRVAQWINLPVVGLDVADRPADA